MGKIAASRVLLVAAALLLAALASANATFERLCSAGGAGRQCADGLSCIDSGISPVWGLRHFDSFGGGFVALLQCTTLDGWSLVMYQAQDAVGTVAVGVFTVVVLCTAYGVALPFLNIIVVKVQPPRPSDAPSTLAPHAVGRRSNGTLQEEARSQPHGRARHLSCVARPVLCSCRWRSRFAILTSSVSVTPRARRVPHRSASSCARTASSRRTRWKRVWPR